ncbi:MAG: alpha-galactosidase [Pseudomonadota bacterium]
MLDPRTSSNGAGGPATDHGAPADLITVSSDQVFTLGNEHFGYVFRVAKAGVLEHLHYGPPLLDPASANQHHLHAGRPLSVEHRGIPDYSLRDLPQEYPTFGSSDFRSPALHGINGDGNSIFQLEYVSHEIVDGKPDLPGLPSARGDGSQTLRVTLRDALQKLEVTLSYTVYRDHGVLCRSGTIKNFGEKAVLLTDVFSSALDLPAADYEVLHLHGSWAAEFSEQRVPLPQGKFSIESSWGTSGAFHNPFVALLSPHTTEASGPVYATTLLYSGNFRIGAETSEFGSVRLLCGINPFNFQWRLEPGETFQTPEALHVYTSQGLREMSRSWHHFVRDRVSPLAFRHQPRPTYLNTWEATYFDLTQDRVLALADKARDVGVDMLVLDDGWFRGRQDDRSSLGDWEADADRFPDGIISLARQVRDKGLKFGLWFEPEAVSRRSQLYEQHPDWILHVPGREPSLGRNQLLLDLSRPEVVDHLIEVLDGYLASGVIDYVKWDMNRCMTEVGSAGWPNHRQLEVPHRYQLGLYRLLATLTRRHPNVLFENCASGGNRFDLGMLHYMAQGWISDLSEPIGRLDIIHGASYLYPLDTTAAYIGPSPNHQNGRDSSIGTRFRAGFFCAARGISLAEDDLARNAATLKTLMAEAKSTAAAMVGGDFYRIIKDPNEYCWQYSSAGGDQVFVAFFRVLSRVSEPFRRAHLVGLDAQAWYEHLETGQRYRGESLMHSGLPLPFGKMGSTGDDHGRLVPKRDFLSVLYTLRRVDGP